MASGEISVTIKASEIPEVRALIEAVQVLLAARVGGADTYEADREIDAVEIALAKLCGYYDRVCSVCGVPFEPRHRWHLDEPEWIDRAHPNGCQCSVCRDRDLDAGLRIISPEIFRESDG